MYLINNIIVRQNAYAKNFGSITRYLIFYNWFDVLMGSSHTIIPSFFLSRSVCHMNESHMCMSRGGTTGSKFHVTRMQSSRANCTVERHYRTNI